MPFTFYEGKNASTTWSAVSQPSDKFDLDFKIEIIDTTNMTSGGCQSNLAGIASIDGSLGGPYDGSLGLLPGTLITITFATGGGGPSWALPMRPSSCRLATAARNQVAQITTQMTSSGTFSVVL